MRELGMTIGILGLLGAVSAGLAVPWESALAASIWVTAAGFAFGVPTGFVYHVQLYRRLAPRDELPEGWYWRPIELNERLRDGERFGVLSWCYAGGLGFLVICAGLVMLTSAVVNALVNGV